MSEWMFKGIEVSVQTSPVPEIMGDPLRLEQAFINIFSNAAEAMPEGGRLNVRTYCEGSEVLAEISDTGTGFGEEEGSKIFEPFYTTKKGGSGTGLGLCICSEIVQQHNGDISISSSQGKGTTVTLRFPAGG